MKLKALAEMPRIINPREGYGDAIHESVFRSYNLLEQVKIWLRRGVPGDVVLELIEEVESLGGNS